MLKFVMDSGRLLFVPLQVTQSLDQLRDFLCGTLLYVQQEQLCAETSLWDVVQQCVDLLKFKGLISGVADAHGETLHVTQLGKATYKGKEGCKEDVTVRLLTV